MNRIKFPFYILTAVLHDSITTGSIENPKTARERAIFWAGYPINAVSMIRAFIDTVYTLLLFFHPLALIQTGKVVLLLICIIGYAYQLSPKQQYLSGLNQKSF